MDPEQQLLTAATIAEATKEIAPEVYKDGLQPTVKELGKSLHTVSKLVNIALTPISALVWSFDKIKDYLDVSLAKRLQNTPEENIVTPDPSVAVPAIETLRYTAQNEEIREMFSNLLATAMDKSTASMAHPSFVEILKQINSDEAKVIHSLANERTLGIIRVRLYDLNSTIDSFAEPIANFSYLPYEINCSFPEQGPSYFVNLERLGLITLSYDVFKIQPDAYDKVENHPIVTAWRETAPSVNKRFDIQRGALALTAFGEKFIDACVISK